MVTIREVVLYIAMSLDGFVADEKGSVAWLGGEDSQTNELGSYPKFIETIDTVILGWKTYHQIVTELSPDNWAYTGMKSYVLTHREMNSTDEIVFTDTPINQLIKLLQNQDGKNIWICGGSSIVNQMIKSNLIDKYIISIIPTILGNGIRLFENDIPETKLSLISTTQYNGITDLVYKRRIKS